MEQGTWFFILKFLPYVSFCSAVAFFLGLWFGRPKTEKIVPNQTSPSKANADDSARAKKLQEKLQQAEADARGLRQEISLLKSNSISTEEHHLAKTDADTLRGQLETEKKRASAFEVDHRKAQEIITSLNARLNNEAKSQSNRIITLENELSKTREALNSTNGSTILVSDEDLRAEVERARETATNAIRLVGDARRREAALQQELDSIKNQKSERSTAKIGPISGFPSHQSDTATSSTPSAAQRAIEQVKQLNEKRNADLAAQAAATVVETCTDSAVEDAAIEVLASVDVVTAEEPESPDQAPAPSSSQEV